MSTIENIAIVCLLFLPAFLVAIVMSNRPGALPESDDALIQANLSDDDIETYNAKFNTSYSTRSVAETDKPL